MGVAEIARNQTGIAAYDVAAALADEHLRLSHSVIVDAVNPIEAPRAGWRDLAAKHRADLKIIECVCADETVHRRRTKRGFAISRACRKSPGHACWNDVPNTKPGPMPDSSSIRRGRGAEKLLARALEYLR